MRSPFGSVGLSVASASAAVALLSACGAGGSPAPDGAATESFSCDAPTSASSTTTVSVAALPLTTSGALYMGINDGTFEKYGLDVEIQPVADIAAAMASVQGGASNFAFAPTISLFAADANGAPLKMVAPFAGIAPGYYDKMKAGEPGWEIEAAALVTKSDSGLDNAGDLDGRTVGLIDVKGQSELATRAVIDDNGGDSDSVKFLNMPLADGLNAFLAGKVDAIYTTDPFLGRAVEAGGQVISWVGVEALRQGLNSSMVASESYIAENPGTVARFNCAMRESNVNANANHDGVRRAIAQAQDVPFSTFENATMAYFYSCAPKNDLENFQDLMLEYDMLSEKVDVEDLLIPETLCEEPDLSSYRPNS
ncbi:ABC transporter substrate-binding protein [[Mycobacterium] appelbergii]|uniref:ABC transporter substrate-binding protein n=1 Tax=[Mycobacterium] appelbergii TaxID=2939269 RepID=UPI002938EA5D|nr:ABC transporter substrate-binding protein [Mycobacterium sp. 21AC1]